MINPTIFSRLHCTLSPFSTHVFRSRWRNFSLAKNLFSCFFVPSKKGQTEDENFQRLDRQNKYLQRRMNVKKYFYVKGGEMMEWKTAFRLLSPDDLNGPFPNYTNF